MFSDIQVNKIIQFHDACVATPGWVKSTAPQFDEGVWKHIELNHRFNSLLWDEEDKARRKDVSDSEIAANKRAIDGYNQKRQNAIESIDELLLQSLADVKLADNARQNSETPGSIIDRLSILSLKIFHMHLQTERTDVDRAHIEACQRKLGVLDEQRADLQKCLDTLLSESEKGLAYFKIYRQHKMYNDPTLNPYLYKKK